MRLKMGIDIGGTNIAAGVLNDRNELIDSYSLDIRGVQSEEKLLDSVKVCAKRLCVKMGIMPSDIEKVGICAPGMVERYSKIVRKAANLPFNDSFMGDVLKPEFQAPVYLANDANAAALGEAIMGTGKRSNCFVMITLGTGVGGGIVINGEIYEGYNGHAGEIGHIIIEKGGRRCGCGQRGCLEAYASANALTRDTKEAMINNPESMLWNFAETVDHITGKTPFEAKKCGDRLAAEIIEAYSWNLAYGIVNIIHVLQPDVISIGGGISKQGEYFLGPVRKIVYFMIGSDGTDNLPRLRVAKLGANAGIIGAAMLGS